MPSGCKQSNESDLIALSVCRVGELSAAMGIMVKRRRNGWNLAVLLLQLLLMFLLLLIRQGIESSLYEKMVYDEGKEIMGT